MSTKHSEEIDTIHARVLERLRADDQRYTDGRRRLVESLLDAGRPVSLPELMAVDPSLPQSSVYRNLDVLESAGLVRRMSIDADHARFELSEQLLGHHHHAICISCGVVEDITLTDKFEAEVDQALAAAASELGFEPVRHTVDLHGLCTTCREAAGDA